MNLLRPQTMNQEYYNDLLNKLSELNSRFEYVGANRIESETEKVLLGLGFDKTDFYRQLNEFSSGWQMPSN